MIYHVSEYVCYAAAPRLLKNMYFGDLALIINFTCRLPRSCRCVEGRKHAPSSYFTDGRDARLVPSYPVALYHRELCCYVEALD